MSKYNITNLDKFISDKDRVNFAIFEPTNGVINKILESRQDLIEDKIKELISPYVDIKFIENKTSYEIRDILKEKGYILTASRDIENVEEYCICEHLTGNRDYFTITHNIDLEKSEAWITISDIIRGIANK